MVSLLSGDGHHVTIPVQVKIKLLGKVFSVYSFMSPFSMSGKTAASSEQLNTDEKNKLTDTPSIEAKISV